MIIIGTRGSDLAMVQARQVSGWLSDQGHENEIRIIKTKGDVVQDRFDKIEGKGFFTAEIEHALLNGDIDVAVHCLKDLPTASPEGLVVQAIPARENPYDILISSEPFKMREDGIPNLAGKRIGTSSNRRVAGLQCLYPDADFVPIRGNVPTRIEKMQRGDCDVVVLAQAGINRLNYNLNKLYTYQAAPPILVPAPAQGALALQTREDTDLDIRFLSCAITTRCVEAERRILAKMEGGCQLPLGVLVAERHEGDYHMEVFLGPKSADHLAVHLSLSGPDPDELATQALDRLGITS